MRQMPIKNLHATCPQAGAPTIPITSDVFRIWQQHWVSLLIHLKKITFSIFILRYKGKKVEMDPIFEHPAFDSARERVECVIRQLEKPQEALKNSLYTCFKCGRNKIFSIAKLVRSSDEGVTVFDKCRDCHNKWRDWLCYKCLIKNCNDGYMHLHIPITSNGLR